MKKHLLNIVLVISAVSLMGCDKQTNEQKVQKQITENQYSLNADERQMSVTNAKQYFEKQWTMSVDQKRGQLINCRPSDSNANGMVSCTGYVPDPAPSTLVKEVKMYCGYRPELVGCSDVDTVK